MKIILLVVALLTISSKSSCKAPTRKDIRKYFISIADAHYAEAFTIFYYINYDSLTVKLKSGVDSKFDSVIVERVLLNDERKLFIDFFSTINIDTLKREYASTRLIDDGKQMVIRIAINNRPLKIITLDNACPKDLANLFDIVNLTVPQNLGIHFTKNIQPRPTIQDPIVPIHSPNTSG